MIGFGILCIVIAVAYRLYHLSKVLPELKKYHKRPPNVKTMEDIEDTWKDRKDAVEKWGAENPKDYENYVFVGVFSSLLMIIGLISIITGAVT